MMSDHGRVTTCGSSQTEGRADSGDADNSSSGEAICPYCGVGCRLRMETEAGRLVRATGVLDAPANLGGICAKGATLPQVVQGSGRLESPLWRASRESAFRAVSWDQALASIALRFRSIIDLHGPDA